MSRPTNIEKNMAIVLLKKAGMPMRQVVKAFGEIDKRNFYRIWYRDKDKYFIKNGNNKPAKTSPQK